jgi:hypothetical protein
MYIGPRPSLFSFGPGPDPPPAAAETSRKPFPASQKKLYFIILATGWFHQTVVDSVRSHPPFAIHFSE